jgi:hypothetical protein
MTAPPDGVWVDNGGWSWLVDGVMGVYVGVNASKTSSLIGRVNNKFSKGHAGVFTY